MRQAVICHNTFVAIPATYFVDAVRDRIFHRHRLPRIGLMGDGSAAKKKGGSVC
jgi:hypothetical protein